MKISRSKTRQFKLKKNIPDHVVSRDKASTTIFQLFRPKGSKFTDRI